MSGSFWSHTARTGTIAWLSQLMCTPYYLSYHGQGPFLSGFPSWAAVGIALGSTLSRELARPTSLNANRARVRLGMLAFGMACLLLATLPSWFIVLTAQLKAGNPLLNLRTMLLDTSFFYISIFFTMASGFALGALSGARFYSSDSGDGQGTAIRPIPCVLLALCSRLSWMPVALISSKLGFVQGPDAATVNPTWVLPWLVTFALATFAQRCPFAARNGRTRAAGKRSASTPPWSFFSLGVLAWSLFLRVVPVRTTSIVWTLVFLAVLSLFFLASVVSPSREAREDVALKKEPVVTPDALAKQFSLSPRESQAVSLLAQGLSTTEIASQLGVQPGTTRTTLSRAYKKMGVSGAEAIQELLAKTTPSTERPERPHEEQGSNRLKVTRPTILLITALCMASLLPICATRRLWGIGDPVVLGVAGACVLSGLLLMEERPVARNDGALAIAFVSIAVALVMERLRLSEGPSHSPVVAGCLFLASGASVVAITQVMRHPANQGSRPVRILAIPGVLCLFFGLGFSWEEVWRSAGGDSLFPDVLPFLAMTFAGAFIELRQLGEGSLRKALLAGMGSLILAALIGWEGAIFLACATILMRFISRHEKPTFWLPHCLAFLGIGALFGYLFGNWCFDLLLTGPTALNGPIDRGTLLSAANHVSTALSLLLGAGAWAGISDIGCYGQTMDLQERLLTKGATERRLLAYLQSRGLNETQSLVLLDIATGKTSREICERRNFALGTINSARNTGYRLLGIHTRSALVTLLSSQVDCVSAL